MLKEDELLRANMGINARRYAERNFPISKIADVFEEIINRISNH